MRKHMYFIVSIVVFVSLFIGLSIYGYEGDESSETYTNTGSALEHIDDATEEETNPIQPDQVVTAKDLPDGTQQSEIEPDSEPDSEPAPEPEPELELEPEVELEPEIDSQSPPPVVEEEPTGPYKYGDIIIKEIYPFDNEYFTEYILIESLIYYSGSLTVAGLGHGRASKSTQITIGPGEIYILSDNLLYDDLYTNHIYFNAISLTDKGEQLTLIGYDQTVLYDIHYTDADVPSIIPLTIPDDSCNFTIEQTTVAVKNEYCNKKYYSHQRVGSGSVITEGCSFVLTDEPVQYKQLIGSHQVCQKEIVPVFGSTDGGGDSYFMSGLTISEIYARSDDMRPEYLELHCEQHCFGTVDIIGLGRGSAMLTVELQLLAQDFLVLTGFPERFPSSIKTMLVPGLSLTDGGQEVTLVGQDGHVLDSVVYTGSSNFTALYRDLTPGAPSPGIYKQLCEEIYPINEDLSTTECGILLQHTSPIAFPNKVNFAATVDGKMIQNSNKSYTCSWKSDMSLESGLLEGCNPSFIGLNTGGVYSVTLEILEGEEFLCATTMSLNFPGKSELPPKEQDRTEYYKGLYQKRKEQYDTLKKAIIALGYSVSSDGVISTKESAQLSAQSKKELVQSPETISIVGLLPNPFGRDDNEEIVLFNHTKQTVTVELFLMRNTRRKLGLQTLLPGVATRLIGSYGLVNKPACVTLQSENEIYDTFCYGNVVEGVFIYDRIDPGKNKQTIAGLGDFTIKVMDADACILYNKQQVDCRPLPVSKSDLRELKKQAKRVETLERRIDRQQLRISKGVDTLQVLRKTYSDYRATTKEEISLHKEIIHLWRNHLQEQYNEIYTSNGLRDIYSAYNTLLRAPNFVTTIGGIPIRSIKALVSFNNGVIPLDDYSLEEIARTLFDQLDRPAQDFITTMFK